ncbi:MAG TPA: lactate racemase domain-containing protein [Actinomycetota bacterium]|nr:lactate racemase domain-containing protein [Actinomycetota bacterium]
MSRTVQKEIVFGDRFVNVSFPAGTHFVSPGFTLPLEPARELGATISEALAKPLDRPPLREQVKNGSKVTIAFDDATVPCYAPIWATAIPLIERELVAGGVRQEDISLICANALHRQASLDELGKLIGEDIVRAYKGRIGCHDAEDPDGMVDLGRTENGYHVDLNRCVTDSDLLIYLNCSTMRAFSGGWKSVCVGLASYRSIHHHHTPDIMSMSLDRNRMHQMLDEMGAHVDAQLGADRIFKLETVLANPLAVHNIYGGSVGATRAKVIEKLRANQTARRNLLDEPVDVVVYGVPDWSPYAAFAHGNPILDLISTGLGYLGGMIEALGKPGCTVVLATPCPNRWDSVHHASYPEVWRDVLPETKDPDQARRDFEPELARREDYIQKYRYENAFHPVHGIMAIYPLKRLRHAGRVIVAGAEDPAIPRHVGFDSAASVEEALASARDQHGSDMTVAVVEYPPAFNRQ